MLVIVGILVVIGSVLGGYLMEGGALGVLIQPVELIIIGGAAVGSLLISTSPVVASSRGTSSPRSSLRSRASCRCERAAPISS